MIDSSQFGKGAIRTPKIIRDQQLWLAPAAPRLLNWASGYSVENGFSVPQRDQKSSLSCSAQATCYYTQALARIKNDRDEVYSARFNYSQSFVAGGGAWIWKAMSIPQKPGLASSASVPDGDSSEATMQDKGLNVNAILEATALKYAVIPRSNIDQLAAIIEDYGGFITGFNGRNDMFDPDGKANVFSGLSDWGHAVWVTGYEMRNGKKCLRFKNSWTHNWGSNGYGFFPEDFVNSGLMFDVYVFAELKDIDPNSMFNLFQVAGDDEVWLIRDVKQADGTFLKMKTHVYNVGALTTISDFANIKPITKAELDAISDTGLDLATLVK